MLLCWGVDSGSVTCEVKVRSVYVPWMRAPGSVEGTSLCTTMEWFGSLGSFASVQPVPVCGTTSTTPIEQIMDSTLGLKSQSTWDSGLEKLARSTLSIVGGLPKILRSGAVSFVLLHERAASNAIGRSAEKICFEVISSRPPERS